MPGDKREFLSWETPSSHFNLGRAVQSLFCKRFDCAQDTLPLKRDFSVLQESSAVGQSAGRANELAPAGVI